MPSISIPKPCNQRWDDFLVTEQGKFCNQCQHIIHDYSQMTDEELLRLFKNGNITCGRFHYSQINRQLIPLPKTTLWERSRKLAATILAIATLKSEPSNARNIQPSETCFAQQASTLTENVEGLGSTVQIAGQVLGEHSKPIEGAIVTFDTLTVKTDSSGVFHFEISTIDARECLLTISYGNLIPVVRNYHPAMGSANYDAVLIERKGYFGGHTMGVPVPFWNSIDTSALHFSKGYSLSKDQQKCLARLADEMKKNPGTPPLNIIGYGRTEEDQKLARKRVEAVLNYMAKKQGIPEDRLRRIVDDSVNKNSIEFVFDY